MDSNRGYHDKRLLSFARHHWPPHATAEEVRSIGWPMSGDCGLGTGNGWHRITFHTNTKNTPNGQPEEGLHLAYEKDVLRQSARYRPENTEKQDDDVQRGRFKSWKSEGRTGCRSRYAIKLRSVDTVPSRRCERREDARVQPRCAHPLIALRMNARVFSLGPRIRSALA